MTPFPGRMMWLLLIAATPLPSAPGQSTAKRDTRIETLLQQMTIEEKVGQMTQVTIDVVSKGETGRDEPHELDAAKLENAILRHNVGSILNVGPKAYTLDHWHDVITGIQDVATRRTRLKIPVLYGIDAVHGANYTFGATIFPQAIAQAASWDPDLIEEIGRITALEVRASGIPWNFYPVLDVGRQPLWPRLYETFGEDVSLVRILGERYIRGLQGNEPGAPDKVAACLKHYAGYSFPLSGMDRTPAWIDERMMREIFLPPFEACILAGAPTVMANSSEVNGVPGHVNHHLLTTVLKGELKFDGFVVSDWQDIQRLYSRDRVAATPKEAVRMAVMAGVDMSMVPYDFSFYEHLLELVKEDRVPVARIDEAVRRILRVKLDLGLFERPYPDKTLAVRFASPEAAALNLRAAREAITLLKNENAVLPLARSSRVLVTGPTANLLSCLNGGWTITWQGNSEELYPQDHLTILEAVQAAAGMRNVRYVEGTTFGAPVNIAAAVDSARAVDVVVVCLGESAYCETPGNIGDLTLDEAQLQLAEAVAQTGTPVVLVLAEGRPRLITRIAGSMKAIVMAYLPGMEGGRAVSDVLFGNVNPSGKLPFTYPRAPNALTPYDHKPLEEADGNRYDPLFPFGFGMSYATFEYSDLMLDRPTASSGERLTASVKVRNTGKRAGAEVVQLYITDLVGSVSRPVRQLKRFARIELAPGQQRTVEFLLDEEAFSFIGLDNRRIVEPGEFLVSVATLRLRFVLE